MIKEGFHPDSLIVTGQPAFDALAKLCSVENLNPHNLYEPVNVRENDLT
jgi:hypothetical protein